jgi:hypothetical protein
MDQKRERIQIRVVTDRHQVEALDHTARLRNVSKHALLREGIRLVTGVASEVIDHPPAPGRGFAKSDHPIRRFYEHQRLGLEETAGKEEGEAIGAG